MFLWALSYYWLQELEKDGIIIKVIDDIIVIAIAIATDDDNDNDKITI